ncbi:MAG TPA: primosomal protein N' [Thermomicrobiales bacterium]|nr:primosomal protein N' [Thermomicrobiales bacterium]
MSDGDSREEYVPKVWRSRFADVAVDGAQSGARSGVFTYDIPDAVPEPEVGQLVWVPLRNKLVHGIVTALGDDEPPFDTRPIKQLVDPPIIMAPEALDVALWMARETASTVFSCAALFLPPGRKRKSIEVLSLHPDADLPEQELTPIQERLVDLLLEEEELTLDAARAATGQALTSVVPELEARGVLRREFRADDRTPGRRIERFVRLLDGRRELSPRASRQIAVRDALHQMDRLRRDDESDLIPLAEVRKQIDVDAATLDALVEKQIIEVVELPRRDAPKPRATVAPVMTATQAAAWTILERSQQAGDTHPHLIFGVTGSGKTEIYLRAVAWCLRQGKTAIVLVPEIGLATQVVRRFIDRFPGQVAVLHSQLTDAERYDIWQSIAAGEVSVVVGPRSVLFTPVRNLGVIVIDEEHDSSYKQDSEPRYHARAVAKYLAKQHGATLVLGSATPAIESFWHAEAGDYRLLELPERVAPVRGSAESRSIELPMVEIVDLRAELRQGNASLLSRRLQEHVERSLSRNEQAILLLNRRGMSTVVMCRACGHRLECPQCDIPLVYHRDRHELICHRCDWREAPPNECPECGGRLDFFGAGTQRVEDEVRKLFPKASVMRWDQDAVRQSGGYGRMLALVEHGEVDIVVGTQMVSKGFDLPGVTSIGVVQADSLLYLPDFRSSERTFQLLTQVAGRAGRRGPGSTVVFQTYTPQHYAILAAAQHDYERFYEDEVTFRRDYRFPPFVRLARFVVRQDKEQNAALEAEMMARALARHARVNGIEMELLGPTPAFVAKIRNQYQWQIVMRTTDMEGMLDGLPHRPGWVVDIDPESML